MKNLASHWLRRKIFVTTNRPFATVGHVTTWLKNRPWWVFEYHNQKEHKKTTDEVVLPSLDSRRSYHSTTLPPLKPLLFCSSWWRSELQPVWLGWRRRWVRAFRMHRRTHPVHDDERQRILLEGLPVARRRRERQENLRPRARLWADHLFRVQLQLTRIESIRFWVEVWGRSD